MEKRTFMGWLRKLSRKHETLRKHVDPLNEDSRELHGIHDLDQVIQHHAIISLEHVKADQVSWNLISLNVV